MRNQKHEQAKERDKVTILGFALSMQEKDMDVRTDKSSQASSQIGFRVDSNDDVKSKAERGDNKNIEGKR